MSAKFHQILNFFSKVKGIKMAEIGGICKRCNKEITTLISRKDAFCDGCFIRFIRGKQRKQMQDDKFKVKFKVDQPRKKLLLDFRNDHESYVLLDIMVSMLNEQLTQGPKAIRGFDLVVAIINDCKKGHQVDVQNIKDFFTLTEIERFGITFLDINVDDFVRSNKLEQLNIDLKHFQTYIAGDVSNKIQTYKELLNQITDKSTKEDIASIIHEDMIISTAQKYQCSIVVKSHSMTQMAVDILADTISGRGSEIPSKSQVKYLGNFEVIHPLQDILYSEIKMYANVRNINDLSPVLQMTASISDVSTKNKTVHDMVTEYFQTLETEYPEVVSTVVKIGAKLSNPKEKPTSHCEICKTPIYYDPKGWLEQITVPGFVPPQNEEEENNLKRYLVSTVGVKEDVITNETEIKICYGCMVTLGVSEIKDFQWPQRPSREDVLAEYILTDDEE